MSASGARDYLVSVVLQPGEERAVSAVLQPPVVTAGPAGAPLVPVARPRQEPR